MFKGTHQELINFFMYAFGLEGYWQKIEQCGLQHLAQQRQATYAGPKLDALNLPDEDKLVLVEMLTPVG